MFPHSYIDIHKHTATSFSSNDALTIYNVYEDFNSVFAEIYCSMGIHPWYIHNLNYQFDELIIHTKSNHVLAIGECGLDRLKGASMETQMKAFEMQIQLANELHKPLIIHCVKAYQETLSMLKMASVPVIFHGFNKKWSIANEVLNQGYYLSFGSDLLNDTSAAFQSFSDVPLNRIFFETDDKEIDIKEIYKAAAFIHKVNEDVILLQAQENFKNLFSL